MAFYVSPTQSNHSQASFTMTILTLMLLSWVVMHALAFPAATPVIVVCDRESLGGCFTQTQDPIFCPGVVRNKTTIFKVNPTDKYHRTLFDEELFNKYVMFEIEAKIDMEKDVMDIASIGAEDANNGSTSAAEKSDISFLSKKFDDACIVTRRLVVVGRIVRRVLTDGAIVRSIMTTPAGLQCSPRKGLE
eukprot:TRINITY_DN78862_c0_g1_i1.p1 TRINITY_DN78862_c0_g1~~TRINITY_DN78862_c0_g1_i1.p1  ORF type:complete len:190 (-),score=34.19 TRINITY_DN78862_c0_g1_i1:426-995(-)